MLYPGRTAQRWALRFPIAPGAEAEAARIRSHFSPQPTKSYNPRIRRNIALVAGICFTLILVAALLLRESAMPVEILVGMAVGGAILALASLILGLHWHIELRKRQRANG